MRTLAIGDVHGCSRAFDALLAIVSLQSDDLLVALGDYVNRGPDSAGVLDRLVRLGTAVQLVPVLGNHEQMMLEARDSSQHLCEFLKCGGDLTLASYGPTATLGDVPPAHWAFLERACRDGYETDTHLFVHANAYPDVPLDEQPAYMLRWESFGDGPGPSESGKVMVCGHTPQKDGWPLDVGHAVCIDTHAHGRGGWLTCLDVRTGRVWQANQGGDTRTGWVDAGPP